MKLRNNLRLNIERHAVTLVNLLFRSPRGTRSNLLLPRPQDKISSGNQSRDTVIGQ